MPCAKKDLWPDDLTAQAKKLFEDGISAAESARALGKSTKAVFSKWARLGLLPPRKNIWPPELKSRLKQLFEDGCSAGATALALDKSRNAVIGQWNRLGLMGTRRRAPRFLPAKIVQHRKRTKMKPPPAPEPKPEPIAPDQASRCSILQLTEHTCRWPIGDVGHPSFCYCGMPTEEQPYCGHHRLRAYSPRQGRGQDANSAN